MAQLYTSGPIPVFCGLGADNTPTFLGHSDGRAPRQRIRRFSQPVHTDLSGPMMSHDKCYLGEAHTITLTLKRYNEAVLEFIQDWPGARTAAPIRGTIAPGDIGSLAVEEDLGFQLWLPYVYSSLAVFQNAGNGAMPTGYHYFNATLLDDDMEGGVTPRGIQISFDCIPVFDVTMVNEITQGGFRLYDHDVAAALAVGID